MDKEECKACAALNAQIATLTARLSAMEEECKALRGESTAAASAVALRRTVLTLTGKDNDDAAVGVLQALRASHDELATTKAKLAEIENAKLATDFNDALEGAIKAGHVTPAKEVTGTLTMVHRPYWEGEAKKDIARATAQLRAYAEARGTTALTGTGHKQPAPATGGTVPTERVQRQIDMGWSAEKRAKFAKEYAEGKVA